jgi:DNA-binding GntR family transcriptional regulator
MTENALNLPPIEHQTLNELAYARLKRALLSGRIEPGTTLTLRQLAEQLGTSMMPVREAVTRLSAENALVVLPKRGIRVPQLSDEEAEDVWSLRLQLEGEACARAARHTTAAGLEDISKLCDRVRRAGEAGDLHGVLEQNSDFQFAIYQAAHSVVLLQMIEILRMRSVPHCTSAVRVMLKERGDYYHQTWRNHEAVVAAIVDGDAQRARREKQADIRAFRAFVRDVTRRHGKPGLRALEEDST